ncbi:MAG: (deoxy)nucleoside triphosphate pyrophosphohydrolase [Desulfovibrionaceae bacterium]|nr:(deoxy)nucleoside triphosphate pyrophosphohydrolase [Desulfovibrionaceae bacterium]
MADRASDIDPGRGPARIDLATGVLAREGRIFIQRRRLDDVWGGLWEFPGGVVEPGETPEQALVRELREELAIRARVLARIAVLDCADRGYDLSIHGFYCAADAGRPVLRAAEEGRFVDPRDLEDYPFPAGHRRLAGILLADARLGLFLDGHDLAFT